MIASVDRDAVENHQVCALSYPRNWTFNEQRVAHDLTPRFAPLIQAVDQTSYKAYQVASVDTGIHRIFVVSDLSSVENRALANQLFPSTIDFIQKLEHDAG